MKYKFPYKSHFQRNFWIYIVLISVLTTLYLFTVKSKSALRKYQKFNIFVACGKIDSDPFKEKINSYIDNDTIKNVVINSCNPTLTSYYTMYSTFGLEDADILILNSNYIVETDLKTHFISFDDTSTYFSDTNFKNNNIHYGLEVYNNNSGYLTQYITYEADTSYYLFVNNSSKHLLGFSKDGETNSVKKVLGGIFNEQKS